MHVVNLVADLLGRNSMRSKDAKQRIKQEILSRGMTVVRRIGRLYVVKGPIPGFACVRWYGWTLAVDTHEQLEQLIEEQR